MKKKISIILTIFFLFAFSINVYAKGKSDIEIDKAEIKKGEEVTITIKLGEEKEIYAYTAKLSYDKEVFEQIKEEDFEEQENWSDITYNANNNKFGLINKSGEAEDENMLKIKLKTKNDAKAGKTEIEINNIEASDGQQDIAIEGSTVEVEIEDAAQTQGTAGNIANNNKQEEKAPIQVKKKTPILAISLIIIIVAITVFLIYYYKQAKEKKVEKNKRNTIMCIGIIINIVLLIIALNNLKVKEADVNNDKVVDYDDAKQVMEYILEITKPKENEDLSNNDVNNDGEITTSDVAGIVDEAKNETDYDVELSDTSKNNTSNKVSSNKGTHTSASNSNNSSTQQQPGAESNPGTEQQPGAESNSGTQQTPSTPGGETKPDPSTPGGETKPDPSIPGKETKPDTSTPGGETKPEPSTPGGEEQEPPVEKEEVDLGDISQNSSYIKKGEEITLTFEAKVTPNIEIKNVIIDGETYKVEKISENVYSVKLKAPSVAGKHEFTITDVILENNKKVSVELVLEAEILKEEPTLNELKIDTDTEEPEITFNIVDEDNAIKGGRLVITDESGEVVLETDKIEKGKNTINIEKLEKYKQYEVKLEIEYDLDNNSYGTPEENAGTKTLIEEKFIIYGDYKFELNNLKVANINRVSKEITLQFESTNISENQQNKENQQSGESYYITSVTINGKSYENVEKKGTTYTVVIPYQEETREVLKLESARLNNSKEFKNLDQQVIIFKTRPKAEVQAEVNEQLTKITAKVKITDEDETLTGVSARLLNEKGETIQTKEDIRENLEEINFELEAEPKAEQESIFKAGEYKIEIGADFELVDGQTHNKKETIGEGTVEVETRAYIKEAKVKEKYIANGENLEITFTIEANNSEELRGITLNNIFYAVTKNAEGTYTILVPIMAMEYGEKTYQVTSISYGEKALEPEETKEVTFYVLKTAPAIENWQFNSQTKEQKITFDYINQDNVITKDAKIIVKNAEGTQVLEQELNTTKEGDTNIAKNAMALNTLPNGKYTISLAGTYNLGDDENSEKTQHNLAEIFTEQQVQVTTEYTAELSIAEVVVKKQAKSTEIKFKATNSSNLEVTHIIINGKKYEVTKQEEADTYIAQIQYEEEENQTITIEGVVIGEDIEVDLQEKPSYEIFKKAPTVKDIQAETTENGIGVKFNIEDTAEIMKNAKVIITNEAGEQVGEAKAIDKDTKEVIFENITKAGTYSVEILADYDRVDGEKHEQERLNADKIEVTIDLDVSIRKINISENYPSKNDNITITYKITTNTDETISALTINGNDVNVQQNGQNYDVIVAVQENYGSQTFEVSQIKFSTGKTKEVQNNEAQIYVLKSAPTIKDYKLDSTKEPPEITFTVENPDAARIKAKALIQKESGETVLTHENITDGTNTIKLEGYSFNATETYKLVLEGIYDLDEDEQNEANEKNIAELMKEEEFQINITAKVTEAEFTKRYLQKGESTEVTYTITSNTDIPITHIFVNEAMYEVTNVGENKYKIEYTPQTSKGVETLEVKKVVFDENEINVESRTDKIEVLKEKPKVADGYEIKQDYGARTITVKLTIEDAEEALKDKKAYITLENAEGEKLTDTNGEEKVGINSGEEAEITFTEVELGTIYTLKVTADYDLDTNALNDIIGQDDNVVTNENLLETTTQLLKAKIEVEEFKVNTDGGKAVVSYNLTDNDNSFVSGKLVITNLETGTESTIPVQKETSSYELEIEPFTKYNVELKITYNLYNDTNIEHQVEEVFGTTEVELKVDYNLEINNLEVTEIDRENYLAVLEFTSTNVSKYVVEYVYVNGEEYPIRSGENKYILDYTYSKENQDIKTEITIEGVKLSNGEKIELGDKKVSATIFKEKPTVSEVKATLNEETNKISGTFTFKDDDKTKVELKAVLRDKNTSSLEEVVITDSELNFSFDQEITLAGEYTVEIVCTYNNVDGLTHEREVLGTQTVKKKTSARIVDSTISNKYPEKNTEIEVTYTVEDNNEYQVTNFQINNEIYAAEALGEDKYKVKYTAPEEEGIHTLNVQKIIYATDEVETIYDAEKVDVLKDIPSIADFHTSDNVESSSVIFGFNIVDNDAAFVEGSLTVEGNSHPITSAGVNSILCQVTPNQLLNVIITVKYDRDTNVLNVEGEENQNESTIVQTHQYTLLVDYGVQITNVGTYKTGGQEKTTYFEKGEDIQIRFNAECVITSLYPTDVKIKDKENNVNSYPVEKVEREDGTLDYYYIVVKGNQEAGVENLEIAGITLSSGKTIEASEFKNTVEQIQVEILKEIPSILNFEVDNQKEVLNVSFDIVDKDDALIESHIIITNSKNEELLKQPIQKENNSYSIKVQPNDTYTVKVERNYDLDQSRENGLNEKHEIAETRVVEVLSTSNFIARRLENAKRVKKGEKVEITFENEYLSYNDVTAIMIDNQRYEVQKIGSVYHVQYEPTTKGINYIKFEKALIGEEEFEVQRVLSFVYDFDVPYIDEELEITENDENRTTAIKQFEIIDNDKAMTKLVAYLKNSNEKILQTKELALDATSVEFNLPKSYKYSIELVAEYNTGDEKTTATTQLSKTIKSVDPRVTIVSAEAAVASAKKSEYITLRYTVSTNIDDILKRIVVNDVPYNATKVDDKDGDTYEISVETQEKSGEQEFEVSQIIFQNMMKDVASDKVVQVQILKDVPTIDEFIVKQADKNISIKLNDEESTVTENPKLVILDESGENELKTEELSKDSYGFEELDLQDGQTYTIKVNAKYNLNTDKDYEENVFEETILERKILIGDREDYSFEFEHEYPTGSFSSDIFNEFRFYIKTDIPETNRLASVIIDGKTYHTTYLSTENGKDLYMVSYYPDSSKDTLNVQKAIFQNGLAFDIPNGQLMYFLWKVPPTVQITSVDEDIITKKVTVNYLVTDKYGTIQSDIKVVLKDSDKKVIGERIVDIGETTVTFDMPTPPTSKYQIEITGDSKYSEFYIVPDDLYLKMEIDSKINTSVTASTLSTYYPKKGNAIAITYKVSSSKVTILPEGVDYDPDAISITGFIVNGVEYEAELVNELRDGLYRIYYTVKDDEGIEEIKVTEVKFNNGTTEAVDWSDKVDVLKVEPQIKDFELEDNYDAQTVTVKFELEDVDSSLSPNSMYAKIGSQQRTVNVGKNTITFDKVAQNKEQKIIIYASYELDTDELNSTTQEKNDYTDKNIFERPFILTNNYGLSFENITTYSGAKEYSYFEKNEEIGISFKHTNLTNLYPIKATINGEEYELIKTDNVYKTVIKGYDTAGIKYINIEKIVLNSGKTVEVSDVKTRVEILKDVVGVNDFSYEEKADEINMEITTVDTDESNQQLRIEVIDEFGKKLSTSTDTLIVGSNSVTVNKNTSEKYFVSVYSDYDRDTNEIDTKTNNYTNEKIFYRVITLNERKIELKDITDVTIYNFLDNGTVGRVEDIDESKLKILSNSLIKLKMLDMPDVYAAIKDYELKDDKLTLNLDKEGITTYKDEELEPLKVTLIKNSEGKFQYEDSIESLVELIRSNRTGEIKLTKNYDASAYTTESSTFVDGEFSGTIDGNGYKIIGLNKPLFEKLKDAKVSNLQFSHVSLQGKNIGALAVTADNTTISDVHINKLTLSNDPANSASLVSVLTNNSVIENTSITDVTISPNYYTQWVGGLVYSMSNSKISNCLVQGTFTSGYNKVGGIVSKARNSMIENSIIKANMTPHYQLATHAGIVADADNTVTLKNNASLITGTQQTYDIYCGSINASSTNNYYMAESKALRNTGDGIVEIQQNNVNENFFKNTLHLDEKIWKLTETSYNNLPSLIKNTETAGAEVEGTMKNKDIYIPEFDRLSKLDGYDSNKEMIYANLYKLMPFYDAKYIIYDGNKIKESHDLNKKEIKYILPFNKQGDIISSLDTNNYSCIVKIKVVFEDETSADYKVEFDNYFGDVASYIISELNIGYNYKEFVMDANSHIKQELVDMIKNYNYSKDLDPLTSNAVDNRLYVEHFEDDIVPKAEQVVNDILLEKGYTPTFDSDIMNNLILQNVVENDDIKRLVYAYNYFDYWYSFKIGDVNLAQSFVFHGDDMFDENMNLVSLTNDLFANNGNNGTNATQNFYANKMAKYTGKQLITDFIEYYIDNFTEYDNGTDWFTNTWKGGFIKEFGIGVDDVYYRAWYHIANNAEARNSLLPLLNLPENTTYIISYPTVLMVGSLRTYMPDPNDKDSKEMQEFLSLVDAYQKNATNFYHSAYLLVGEDETYFNDIHDMCYDYKAVYLDNGRYAIQLPATTEEPFVKYYYGATGHAPASNGSGAYANGSAMFYNFKALASFGPVSHETMHNQDNRIFLKRYGRRGGAEDYAAGNFQQYYIDGWVSPNIMSELENTPEITQNIDYHRVETPEKMYDFYSKYFEASDFLDYLEAKAFLQLTDDEKARVATQVYYPKLENESPERQEKGDSEVGFRPIGVKDIQGMKLTSVDDLYEHRIILKQGITADTSYSPSNGYPVEFLYTTRWYEPHNDDGRPDPGNFKYHAWMMLGEGGFEDGYIAYYSGTYITKNSKEPTTDLMALRYITHNNEITWKEYRLNKYREIEANLNNTSLVDCEEIIEKYKLALEEDARNKDRKLTASVDVKRQTFNLLKTQTDEFTTSIFDKKTD